MDLLRRQAERFGTRFVSGAAASADFRTRPFAIALESGEVLRAHAVIVATGATARYLGLPNEQKLIGRGVSACATCDGAFFKDVPIAVVGGGDTAMEEASFLARFASKVTLIHRRREFRASRIMAERVLKNPKIEVRWDTVVEDVLDVARNRVTALRLRHVPTGERSDLPVEGLFVAIGHQPNTAAFAGQLETDAAGYLVARHTRTSVEGVFAAGDVADPVYRQAVTAAGSGCMAALEAARHLEHLGH
jgi:thioredoxin reductase (NADPH)